MALSRATYDTALTTRLTHDLSVVARMACTSTPRARTPEPTANAVTIFVLYAAIQTWFAEAPPPWVTVINVLNKLSTIET